MIPSWKTRNHKHQTKLVANPTNPMESTPESPRTPQEQAFLKEIEVPEADFIAARIEEGENPVKALELWEIALKHRNRRKA